MINQLLQEVQNFHGDHEKAYMDVLEGNYGPLNMLEGGLEDAEEFGSVCSMLPIYGAARAWKNLGPG